MQQITLFILSARSKRRHYLEQNVQATEIVLTAADLKHINALAQPAGTRYDAASLRFVNA